MADKSELVPVCVKRAVHTKIKRLAQLRGMKIQELVDQLLRKALEVST